MVFCHTSTRICHRCTCVPNPEPLSHLPPRTIPLGHPNAPAPSILYPASNLDWWFVSYMILYMFRCHSLQISQISHPVLYICVETVRVTKTVTKRCEPSPQSKFKLSVSDCIADSLLGSVLWILSHHHSHSSFIFYSTIYFSQITINLYICAILIWHVRPSFIIISLLKRVIAAVCRNIFCFYSHYGCFLYKGFPKSSLLLSSFSKKSLLIIPFLLTC